MAIDPNDVQGVEANGKDDTLFYGESATSVWATLKVDLSQTGTDWEDDTSWIYVDSPGPGNIQHPLAVEVSTELDNTTSGWLFSHDSSGGTKWGVRVNAGVLEYYQDDTLIESLALPGVDASADGYVVAFSSETNPYTTGAADLYRCELRAYNSTDTTYDQIVFTAAARTLGAGATVFMAESTDGTGTVGENAYALRLGQGRFHSSDETVEDILTITTAPTLEAQSTIEFPAVDPACDLEDAGQFTGPLYAMAAASVRANHLRQVSPLVCVHYFKQPSVQAYSNAAGLPLYGIPTPWKLTAPDASYTFFGNYFYKRLCPAVPQLVNEAKIRIHAQMWRTSGATNDRIYFRVYLLNKSPGVDGFAIDNEESIDYDYGEASMSTSHGSGATGGEWLDLGRAVIKRDASGYTWVALAVRVEDLSGDLNAQLFKIRALSVEPERMVYEAGVPGG